MIETVCVTKRFLDILGELERFRLPPRKRILPGEAIGGKVRAAIVVGSTGEVVAAPPPPRGTIAGRLWVRAAIRIGVRSYSELVAEQDKARKAAERPRRARKPRSPAPAKAPRAPAAAKPPRRTREEGWASGGAKLHAQYIDRVAAIRPLVEEARAAGCLLLSEIGAFLDDRGCTPPQGEKWAHGTLFRMIPDQAEYVRKMSDKAIKAAFRADVGSDQKVADWLNERGHRTARGKAWTRANVQRWKSEHVA